MIIDDMSHDNAGNITSMRIRGFDTTAHCTAATLDIVAYEVGENSRFDVTQTHDLPRNLRSSHKSVTNVAPSDEGVTANTGTDTTDAPGNTTWPEE